MKPKLYSVILLAVALAILAAFNSGRAKPNGATSDSDILTEGVSLLKQGRIVEARSLLTNLPASSPVHGQAKAFIALSRYAEGDRKKFINTVKLPEVQSADLPEDVREDLDYKQIDSLMYFRRFDEVLPKSEQFAQRHSNSPRAEAIVEYQIASLYERGMKKLSEAAQLRARGDAAGAANRLQEGQDNLGQYLKLAVGGKMQNYQTLPDRNFQEEVVQTLTALGGEDEALKLVTSEGREAAQFALVKLHKKIDSDADANLRRMTNFLAQYPDSKHSQRVKYDMASVALEEGWRLTWENKCNQASSYLAKAKGLLNNVAVDPAAGISEADMLESQTDLLRIFYAQNDWKNLSRQSAKILSVAPTGGRDWIAAKLYVAAGLFRQKKTDQAAHELDDLLASGFKGNPTIDGLLVSAAEWRIRVARQTDDEATIQRVSELVQKSDCYGSLKRTFTANFNKLAAQPKSISN